MSIPNSQSIPSPTHPPSPYNYKLWLCFSFLILFVFFFSSAYVVQSLSCFRFFATPWIAASQASLYFTISWGLLELRSIHSLLPFNHLILCHPFLLLDIIWYLSFSLYLTPLSKKIMIISRSLHAAANDIIPFFLMANIPLHICTTSSLPILLSMDA